MSSTGERSDDKVVVDPAELDLSRQPREREVEARADEPITVRAKGTREQLPLAREPDPRVARSRGSRDVERDPVEVLRTWPHSTGRLEDHGTVSRATLPAASVSQRFDDKIVLAHLALDLYRELEDVQATTRGMLPARREPVLTCEDQRCQARTNALRGALIEACLLVQRVALLTPTAATKQDVDDRLRGLLVIVDS